MEDGFVGMTRQGTAENLDKEVMMHIINKNIEEEITKKILKRGN